MANTYGYTFSTVEFPGSLNTVLYGINDAKDVVGSYEIRTSTIVAPNLLLTVGGSHGFTNINSNFYTTGSYGGYQEYSDLNGPYGNKSYLPGVALDINYDINNLDQVLGDFNYKGFIQQVTVSSGGDGSAGYFLPQAPLGYGINDVGQIVGDHFTATHGVVSSFSFGVARGINNAGDVVGYNGEAGHMHGFIVKDGVSTAIDAPGAVETQAFGINEVGQIAGTYTDSLGHHHGFVETNGTFFILNEAGTDTFVYGINNAGQVVGSYTTSSGDKGFIATPHQLTNTDTLTLRLSEDQWTYHPDAQFLVKVDGQQVGDVHTVTALHSAGQTQDVTLTGDFSGAHQVAVQFLNDQYGGTNQDVNLYVDSLSLNGRVIAGSEAVLNAFSGTHVGASAELFRNGSAVFNVASDTLAFRVSEDQWTYHPDAQFVVTVDGKQVGDVHTVTALHNAGQTQDVTLTGDFSGAHKVAVQFLNDQYGGTNQDVNLYIDSISLNGRVIAGSEAVLDAFSGTHVEASAELFRNGSAIFNVDDLHHVGMLM